MKCCQICGELVGIDVQTCPKDGEASWHALSNDPVVEVHIEELDESELEELVATEVDLTELAEPDPFPLVKRGPGRPRKT